MGSMSSGSNGSWRHWNASVWNRRLFAYYFEEHDDLDEPVRHLSVTSETLATAVGAPRNEATSVRDAFVSAMSAQRARTGLATFVRAVRRLGGHGVNLPNGVIPTFAHLVFTCLVASCSPDPNNLSGNYRERLCAWSNRDGQDTLQGLAELWEEFRNWLEAQRADGNAVRPLELPFARHVIIGYSVGLAFPHFQDWCALHRVLCGDQRLLCYDPPVRPVVRAVAARRSQFSRAFVEHVDHFDRAWRQGDPNARALPFWSLVRDIARGERWRDAPSEGTADGGRMTIVAQMLNRRLRLAVVSEVGVDDERFECRELEAMPWSDPHRFLLLDATSRTPDAVVQQLLGVASDPAFPRHLRLSVSQPFVAFVDMRTHFALARQLPRDGCLWLLVRNEHAERIRSLLARHTPAGSIALCDSFYDGYREIHDISVELVWRLVRCDTIDASIDLGLLEPSVAHVRPRLVGGVRIEREYLGVAEHLPRVRIEAADRVEARSLDVPEAHSSVELHLAEDGLWAFPCVDLAGTYQVHAQRGGTIIGRTDCSFVPDVHGDKYLSPTTPLNFNVEGARQPSADFEPSVLAGLEVHPEPSRLDFLSSLRDPVLIGPESRGRTEFRAFDDRDVTGSVLVQYIGQRVTGLPSAISTHPAARTAEVTSMLTRAVLLEPTVEAQERFDVYRALSNSLACSSEGEREREQADWLEPDGATSRLVRVVAATAQRRTGIILSDALRLLDEHFGVSYADRWSILRAWTENCLVDRATYRSWRRQLLFARRPALVVVRRAGHWWAAVSGLVTPWNYEHLRRAASERGLEPTSVPSRGQLVPPGLRVVSRSFEALEALMRDMDWARPVSLDLSRLPRPLDEVIGNSEAEGIASLDGYERGRSWCWTRYRFAETPEGLASNGVSVEEWTRPDAVTVYVVARHDRQWRIPDRNWALLWAYRCARQPLFARAGRHAILALIPGVYLPLGWARIAALTGPCLPGPTTGGPGQVGHYIYEFPSHRMRELAWASVFDAASFHWLQEVEPLGWDVSAMPLPAEEVSPC